MKEYAMLWSKSRVMYGGLVISLATLLATGCGGGTSTSSVKPAPKTLDNRVTIASGSLVGNSADAAGIVSFKGIPYAAPPQGSLRWKEPQPVPSWSSARDATQFGYQCWAASAIPALPPIPIATANKSEDCLNLNVWSGAKTSTEKLPVMVWLHGGGFEFASGSDPEYDGTSLAKKGVVVVTLNYRLGVFGFLARADLDAESAGHKSGMYGLQDQIAALQWVKKNIAEFGGNPNNITLFGESAGAHAAGLLMASPLTAGLFNKVIGQSGAFWESEAGIMKSYTAAQAMGANLGTQIGQPAATLAQLRAISPLELQTKTDWTFLTNPQVTAYSPIIDGYVVPGDPYLRFKSGQQNDVPLLAGWNTDEGKPFANRGLLSPFPPGGTAAQFNGAATKKFGAANMKDFQSLYPAATDAQAALSSELLEGDETISYQTWGWVTQHHRTGRSPIFVYNFSYTSAYTPFAQHLAEVNYVFGNLCQDPVFHPGVPTSADQTLSDQMQTYWTNFARTGNPNGTGLPQWPAYAGASSQTLQIGNTLNAGAEEGTARFQFLDRFR
jgi:para-nitrobenzyl esterase